MKTAEIIDSPTTFTVYQMMRLDAATGVFMFKVPDYTKHKLMGNLWADINEVNHEQMLEAIKGTQWTIVKIDWSIR
jgi:hypothetical protein